MQFIPLRTKRTTVPQTPDRRLGLKFPGTLFEVDYAVPVFRTVPIRNRIATALACVMVCLCLGGITRLQKHRTESRTND